MLDQDAYASPTPPQGKGEAAERALRNAIVHCVLAPGERLSEVELAREFDLGRGAVRTALARLQASGFVSSAARSGWSVAPVSASEIRELCAARRQLEPLLCNVTLGERETAHLRNLAEMHLALTHRQEIGGDILSTVRRCERDILECLSGRLGMPIVAGWLADLWDRSARLVNFFEASGPVRLMPADRARFVEALLDGRKADAGQHLASANGALEVYLLDRFLESGAKVGAAKSRRTADRDTPIHTQPGKSTPGIRTV
ncbi:GntR family transcriptional regulator [Nitratireductor sp. ZSWI3]|uniref:GntR family transcriptional regulator n=1 Tax=Nitratireductor sp. ZSWI3 TaxID=2966359 RepID=UPI0021500D93|nr:GntR family transcriptional regulator [Nitratireductor sp. ZSWI3]MCR4265235.1 GntR family transcriptional regulator [Nitratireductor sp. ZSWI3]